MSFLNAWRERRWLPLQICVVSAIILLLTLWLWWGKVSVEPGRVFDAMLHSSLSTASATFTVEQKDQGDVIRQSVQLNLGAEPFARSLTTIARGGDTVTTETLGTFKADYMRYINIKTGKAGPDGKPVDVGKLTNVWAKTTSQELKEQQGAPLFQLAALGLGMPLGSLPVPISNLTPEDRDDLLKQIKQDKVYDYDPQKVEKRSLNGRLTYAYPISLQPVLYVHMMQSFAHHIGMTEIENIDPNSFSGEPPFKMTLLVDAHSRRLVQVEFPNKNYQQTYSGYGIEAHPQVPTHTITGAELQQRLSVLQN